MKAVRRQPGREADKGFILVLVLWTAILLALLAAGFSVSVRTHIRSTAAALALARAQAFADGGVNLALMDLVSARRSDNSGRRFALNGQPVGCRIGDDALLSIRIEDEGGKVNLNLASERLLSTFFAGLGVSAIEADGIAARVLDFSDADDDPRPNGAERADYVALGSKTSPKNSAFDTVDELEQVLGVPAELVARAKTFATVHSGLAGLDETVMPPGLQAVFDAASLSGATEGIARASALGTGGRLPTGFSARSTQQAFQIHVVARLQSGVQYVAQTLVAFSDRSVPRYVLHQWRQGSVTDADRLLDAADAVMPPC